MSSHGTALPTAQAVAALRNCIGGNMWPRSTRLACVLAGLLGVGAVVRMMVIFGVGYSLDEEITYFSVRGIQEHALPLFPSGVLNDRGVPFSYVAWFAERLVGQSLVSYRAASVIFGVFTLWAVNLGGRHVTNEAMALLACALVVASPLHIAVSGWGRFYSFAIALYLTSVVLFFASRHRPKLGGLFLACLGVAATSHELGITLVALPIMASALERDSQRRKWNLMLAVASVVIVAISGAVIAGLNFVAPNQGHNPLLAGQPIGGTGPFSMMPHAPLTLSTPATRLWIGLLGSGVAVALVRYRKAPPVLLPVCLTLSALFQLGLLILAVAFAVILRPARLPRHLVCGAVSGLAAAVFWTVHTSLASDAAASFRLLKGLAVVSLSYPWDSLLYHVRSLPVTFLLVGIAGGSAIVRPSSDARNVRVRMLFGLVILNFAVLGALNLPVRSRHVMVFWPVIAMLIVVGFERAAFHPPRLRPGVARGAIMLTLILGLITEHTLYAIKNPLIVTKASGPLFQASRINPEVWTGPLSIIPRNATVISNDELACMYHVGRVDYWLASNPGDLAQYALLIDGVSYGLYAGGRQIFDLNGLAQKATQGTDQNTTAIVLFNTGRFASAEYRDMAIRLAQRMAGAVISEAPGVFILLIR